MLVECFGWCAPAECLAWSAVERCLLYTSDAADQLLCVDLVGRLIIKKQRQAALLLRDHDALESPFFLLAPHWFQWPLLILASLAAVIASQAVISGVFSVTQQGIQLGFIPRLTIRHTSQA